MQTLTYLEDGAATYLLDLASRQSEPVLVIEREPLEAAMLQFGAKGISVPDLLEPFQIHLPLYVGVTTPRATSEVPHWHSEQAEAYVMISGEAEMIAKHRWQDEWICRTAHAGGLLLVQPQVCHWFRWQSSEGLALVFKAPQRAGVGRFPAGKVTCHFCPRFKRGCILPDGYSPPE